jgi:hypothetical protein
LKHCRYYSDTRGVTDNNVSSGYEYQSLLVRFLEVVRTRKGRGARIWPMMERNRMWRKVQSRLQWSRTRPKTRRQNIELRKRPLPRSSKTGLSDLANWSIHFSRIRSEGKSEDYHIWDDTITSLVSTWAHV